ncbi:hypothetical protein [Bradyrhizobium sp. SZCCHNR1051]|uniref:hypothetical protein n=1 Tax=Bradyrhizobium sp. SZCCHNR1051 TaxID=3057355 RepID=UPI00291680CD|nr:hypothetical protein [Bradyrhizobium sp. SZCCHNR1051]
MPSLVGQIRSIFSPVLLPHEGRFATVTDRWQWDAMGVDCRSVSYFTRTNGDARTVKSRGPDTPMLVSRAMRASALSRMVANKPGAPRRSRSSRSNRRAGKAGCFRLHLWYLPPAFF